MNKFYQILIAILKGLLICFMTILLLRLGSIIFFAYKFHAFHEGNYHEFIALSLLTLIVSNIYLIINK